MPEQTENSPGPAGPVTDDNALRVKPLVFVALSLIGIFFLYQVVGGGLTLLIFGQSVTADNVQWMRAATMIAQVLFLLLPTWLLIRYQHGSVWKAIPWRAPKVSEFVLTVAAVF